MDPTGFEHLATTLAMAVLGPGITLLGPGSDGGRDAVFEGAAPYPSTAESWSGLWYVQSKHHRVGLSKDHNKWLLAEIKNELREFSTNRRRRWPDVWIVVSNIDPGGAPETGCFDAARAFVEQARPSLKDRFHIWGGKKVDSLLAIYPEVARAYAHLISPGIVLSELRDALREAHISADDVIEHMAHRALDNQRYARLEQVGSASPRRLELQEIVVDVPCRMKARNSKFPAISMLSHALANTSRAQGYSQGRPGSPVHATTWRIFAGPGRGKTTIGAFLCQVHRAALILQSESLASEETKSLAERIRERALELGAWPANPRVPLRLELSDYAVWASSRPQTETGVLQFVRERMARETGNVSIKAVERALQRARWLFVFDGLDEVPMELKDRVAEEVIAFHASWRERCDMAVIATSRPQGYSGQFQALGGVEVELADLSVAEAMTCATRLLQHETSEDEARRAMELLRKGANSAAVQELLRTPLLVHIMAVIVRGGQAPPERKWKLFQEFFDVTYRREAAKDLGKGDLSVVLKNERLLLKNVHNALGFVLQAAGEVASQDAAALSRRDFVRLVQAVATRQKGAGDLEVAERIVQAAGERLVLINTPDAVDAYRFDVRLLQEYFAGEFLYYDQTAEELGERMLALAGQAHWREVVHFLISALIEDGRRGDLIAAIDVLRRLNLDSDGGDFVTASVKLGSQIAGRILADGVLEGRGVYREMFRSLLEELLVSESPVVAKSILAVSGADSKEWVKRVALALVRERQPSHCIAAAAVLWLDGGDTAKAMQSEWSRWQPADLNLMCAFLVDTISWEVLQWDRLAELLLSDVGISFLPLLEFVSHGAGIEEIEPEGAVHALRRLVAGLASWGVGHPAVCGAATVYRFERSELSSDVMGALAAIEAGWQESPLVRLFGHVIRFQKEGTVTHLMSALEMMCAREVESIGPLSGCARSRKLVLEFGRRDGRRQVLAWLREREDAEGALQEGWDAGCLGTVLLVPAVESILHLEVRSKVESVADVLAVCDRAPKEGLALLLSNRVLLRAMVGEQPKALSELVFSGLETVLAHPLCWLELEGALGGEGFADRLRTAAAAADVAVGRLSGLRAEEAGEWRIRPLVLPIDLPLVKWVGAWLAAELVERVTMPGMASFRSVAAARRAYVSRWLDLVSIREGVVSRDSLSHGELVALLVLGMLHDGGGAGFVVEYESLIVEVLSGGGGGARLVAAVLDFVLDDGARPVLGRIAAAVPGFKWQWLHLTWGERSRPVAAGLVREWLGVDIGRA